MPRRAGILYTYKLKACCSILLLPESGRPGLIISQRTGTCYLVQVSELIERAVGLEKRRGNKTASINQMRLVRHLS